MAEMNFNKLADRLKALASMCNFEKPAILCYDKELYFRGLYDRTNKEMTSLVSLAAGNG